MKIIKTLFLALILQSCSNGDNLGNFNRIKVQSLKNDNFKLYDYAEKIEIIPLESKGYESLVGIILKIDLSEDYFILLSANSSGKKSVHLFEIDGRFKKSFSEIETDYSLPVSVEDFVKVGKSLAIVGANNILYFLDENFEYQLEKEIDFKSDVFFSSNEYLLSYTNQKAIDFQPDSLLYELLLFDSNFDLVYKGLKFDPKIGESRFHHRLSHNIQTSKEGFLFTKFLNDTIFLVNPNGITSKYIVDFEENRFDINMYPDLIVQPFSPILVDKFSWGVSNPIETSQGVFFEYYDKNLPIDVFYNPITGEGMIFNPMNIIKDENLIPWPKYYKEGYFYGVLTESDMGIFEKNSVEKYSENSNVKNIYNIIKGTKNPVFIKYKLNNL